MNAPDILEYIRAALITAEPLTPAHVEHAIQQARKTWGGDTVYVHTLPRQTVTRRTLQRRRARSS